MKSETLVKKPYAGFSLHIYPPATMYSLIRSLHGRDTMEDTMYFDKMRIRRTKLITDMDFLKHC